MLKTAGIPDTVETHTTALQGCWQQKEYSYRRDASKIFKEAKNRGIIFFYLIYFEIRYLTAIIFDETRITIRATHTKNTDPV